MAQAQSEEMLAGPSALGAATPSDNPDVAWRALAVLWLCGATIGALSLVLPHPGAFDDGALWTNVAIALGGAAFCALAPGRIAVRWVEVLLAAGTLAITRAVYLSGDASSYYAFFYIWVGPYAFLFLGRWAGLLQMLVLGGAYG